MTILPQVIKYQQNKEKEGNHKYFQLIDFKNPNSRPNNGGWTHNWVDKNIAHVRHVNDVTSATQKW